jgi:hypothetical protein
MQAVRQIDTNLHCTETCDAQARVLQLFPATVPAAKHMRLCLSGLRHRDNFSCHDKPCLFIWTLPFGQLYHIMTNPARLPGLYALANFSIIRNLL